MLRRARALAARERLENVSYELGNAPVCPLRPRALRRRDQSLWHDVLLRSGSPGRENRLCPAHRDAGLARVAAPRAQRMGTGNRRRARQCRGGAAASRESVLARRRRGDQEMLDRAGFEAVRFEDVHEPFFYGHDVDAALEFVCGFRDASAALAGMSRRRPPSRGRAPPDARGRLRRRSGVAFDSRSCWSPPGGPNRDAAGMIWEGVDRRFLVVLVSSLASASHSRCPSPLRRQTTPSEPSGDRPAASGGARGWRRRSLPSRPINAVAGVLQQASLAPGISSASASTRLTGTSGRRRRG